MPKIDRIVTAQEAWLARQIRTTKADIANIREIAPDLALGILWEHAESPEALLKHVEEVLKGSDPAAPLHAALHLGELNQALKIAAHARKEAS